MDTKTTIAVRELQQEFASIYWTISTLIRWIYCRNDFASARLLTSSANTRNAPSLSDKIWRNKLLDGYDKNNLGTQASKSLNISNFIKALLVDGKLTATGDILQDNKIVGRHPTDISAVIWERTNLFKDLTRVHDIYIFSESAQQPEVGLSIVNIRFKRDEIFSVLPPLDRDWLPIIKISPVKQKTSIKAKAGRKTGDGKIDDEKWLKKITKLIESGKAANRHKACQIVYDEQKNKGNLLAPSLSSFQKRIATKLAKNSLN